MSSIAIKALLGNFRCEMFGIGDLASQYPLITVFIGVAFSLFISRANVISLLRLAFFLLIPYATMAILLPRFTGNHPYATDQIMAIPATFLISFWFLQKEFGSD